MKNQTFTISLFLIFTIFFSTQLFSQTPEQINFLRQYGQEKRAEKSIEKQQAEATATRYGFPISRQNEDGSFIELQSTQYGVPLYITTHNINAARTISTYNLWSRANMGYNLTGAGITLGIWDAGRTRLEHQEFTGRAFQMDGATSNHNHATHVGATMIAAGIQANAVGMSYEGTLHAYDWNYDTAEMAEAAADGLRVSNHSYGYITGWRWNYFGDNRWVWFGNENYSTEHDYRFGFYDPNTRDHDIVAYNSQRYLIVKSAGNDRNGGPSSQPVQHWIWNDGWQLSNEVRSRNGGPDGFDCISTTGNAKNILTVAATNAIPAGYSQPSDVVLASFSSWGPTDDGRIKPDISANGVGLYSATASSNSSYASYSGTSMSAPNISGSIGLLLEHYKSVINPLAPLSSTMKALIIHTADAAGVSKGPDYSYGWGLMNSYKAAELISKEAEKMKNLHIKELTLADGEFIEFEVYSLGVEPLKATIVWTDPAANVPEMAYNNDVILLVNDLDMRITSPVDEQFMPWILDPANPAEAATTGDNFRDNVEQILIEETSKGTYIVRIEHKGELTDGEQVFSMIISGNFELETSQLLAPLDNAENISLNPEFSWTAVENAEQYELSIYEGTEEIYTILFNADDFNPSEDIHYTLENNELMLFITDYTWDVKAINGPFVTQSETWQFTTIDLDLETPVLISPIDNDEDASRAPEFVWEYDENAIEYELNIYQNEELLYSVLLSALTYLDNNQIHYELPHLNSLEHLANFIWNVKAINRNISELSDEFAFKTGILGGALAANLPNLEICKNSNEELSLGHYTEGISTTVVGGSGDYTLTWIPTNGLIFEGDIAHPKAKPLTTITYTLRTKDNVTGLIHDANVTVTVNLEPKIIMTPLVQVQAYSPISNLNDFAEIRDGSGMIYYYWRDNQGFEVNPENFIPPMGLTRLFLQVTDEKGCVSLERRIILYATMGKELYNEPFIAGNNENLFMQSFPTPASNKLNLNIILGSQAEAKLTLVDIAGREVYSEFIIGEGLFTKEIDVSLLPAGVYMLILDSADDTVINKVIKID